MTVSTRWRSGSAANHPAIGPSMSSCDGCGTRSTAARLGTPSSRPGTGSATGSSRSRRSESRDRPAAVRLVDDVDGLVLAVRTGDPEQHREPANRPQPPFLGEDAAKDELVAEAVEVAARLLPDAVHVHLVTISDAGW